MIRRAATALFLVGIITFSWRTKPSPMEAPRFTIPPSMLGYSSTAVEAALASMQTSGYNTIRVWLNGCCQNGIGNSAGGLSSAYLANVADFLHRAKNHGIFAIFTTDWVPSLGGYGNNYGGCTQFSGYNTVNLCAGG